MKNAARPIHKADESARDARPAFRLRPIAYCVMLACCDLAVANPNGPQVISGNVQFQGLGTDRLSITNTPGAIINWQGFSINAGQLTQFLQQNAASTVLNRVVGGNISQIQGQLSSNGRVFLINPAGIVIGAGAMIDTAGFVGSTLNILDADFLKGKLSFQGDGKSGSIVNQGYIKTTHGGDIVLVAPNIENSGIIQADGKLLLAAGQKLTIGSLDANDVQFEVQAPSDSVINIGQLIANGGAVGAFAGTLKHTGDIRATSMSMEGGRVVLKSQGDTVVAGNSTITATGDKGGTVQVLGERVAVYENAKIETSGEHGGGTILIGGDYQGRNPDVQNAKGTFIGGDTIIAANAKQDGDGGKIIVWSDDSTRVYGSLSAVGAGGGKGGFVETSGHYFLDVGGLGPDVGVGGMWLLDPFNITVTAATNSNNTNSPNFTPTGNDSQVSAAAINTRLSSGNSVTLNTAGAGTQAGNITVNAPITKSSSNTSVTLTLTANGSITVNSAITKPSAAGNNGDLNVVMNAGDAITVNAQIVTPSPVTMTAGTAPGATGGITLNHQINGSTGSNGDPGMSFTTNVGNIVINTPPGSIFSLAANGDTVGNPVLLSAPSGALINNSTAPVVIQDAALTVQTAQGMTGSAVPTLQTDSVRSVAVTAGAGNFAMNNAATALTVNASSAGAGRSLTFSAAAGQTISTGGAISVGSGGSVSLTGDTLTIGHAISAPSGTVSLTGDNLVLTNSITASGGAINISSRTRDIALGGVAGAGGTFDISNTEIGFLTAAGVRIRGISGLATQDIAVTGAVAAPASVGALSLQTAGTITQPGAGATLAATSLEASGSTVNLPLGNAVATIAGAASGGGAFTYNNAGDVQVGSVLDFTGITTTGNVTLSASAGITGTAAARVTGNNVILDSQTGIGTSVAAPVNVNAVTLAAGAPKNAGVFVSELNSVTLDTLGGVVNAGLNVYDLRAGGSIVVAGPVGGAGAPTVLTSGGSITAGAAGAGIVNGQTIALDSATGIGAAGTRLSVNTATLAARSTTGNSSVFLSSGATAVALNDITIANPGGGTTTIRNGAAGTGVYDLLSTSTVTATTAVNAAASNNGNTTISGTGIVVGADIGNANATTPTTTALTVTTGGITGGAGTVIGNTVNLLASASAIGTAATRVKTSAGTLSAQSQDTGIARSVFLQENDAVSLTTSSAALSGTFDLTAGGPITLIGNVTTNGAGAVNLATTGSSSNTITQTGGGISTGTLTLTTAGANVDLPSVTNAVTNLGLTSLGAGSLNLRDTGGIAFAGNLNASGGVTVNTTGAVTQTGPITATGALTVSSNNNLITLGTAGNDFQGTVSLNSGGGTITVVDTNAVSLGTTNTGGSPFSVTAGGPITQTGAISASTGAFNANGNAITLTNGSNDFTGPVTFTNNTATVSDISITDANALAFGIAGAGGYRNFTARALGGALSVPALTTSGAQTFQGTGVTLNGDLTTTSGSISITGATTLSADRIITAGSAGDIAFNGTGSTINGPGFNLTLNSTGTTTLGGAVGGAAPAVPLLSLTTNAGGSTVIGGGTIRTSGAQTYGDAVTLGSATTLTSTGNNAITFANTGSVNGPSALTIATGGATVLNGPIGTGTPLASLATGTGPVTIGGGFVTTTAGQTYSGAVTLTADTTLTGTNPTFTSTVAGGGNNLALDFSGLTTIGANFSGIRNLSTGNNGTTSITGNISTTGTQTYNDAVTLDGSTPLTLTSTGAGTNGNIAFNNTLNGGALPVALTIVSPGTTTFGGTVGGVTPVTSIATDGPGSTSLAASITTAGAQNYGDEITVPTGVTTTLASTGGGDIAVGATLNGPGALVANTGGLITLPAGTGATTPLASITTGGTGTTSVTGTVTTDGAQTYNTILFLRGPTDTTLVSNSSGNIVLGGAVDGAQALTVSTGGITRFGAPVGAVAGVVPTSLTTDGGGTTEINTATVTTTGLQDYGDNVTLGVANTTLNAGAAAITFGGTLNGASNLTLTTTGNKTFGGLVGGAPGGALTSVTSNGGTTLVNGGVTTTGNQTYAGVTLIGNSTFTGAVGDFGGTITGGGFDLALNFSGASTLDPATFNGVKNLSIGGGGATTISGTISTTGTQTYDDALTLGGATTLASAAPGGDITLNNTVNGPFAFTVTTPGTTAINGGSVTTTGAQTYNGAVALGAATTISAGTAAVTFGGTLNSATATARALTIATTGPTTFTGAVGNANPLASLDTAAGTTAVNGGGVTTTGAQTYNGPTTVGANTLFASNGGGAISFGTLNGTAAGLDVTVNTTGDTIFRSPVGAGAPAPGSLATNAGGRTLINGGAITTTGAQSYGDTVVLGAATTFDAGAGNLTFGSTLNGAFDVNLNSTGTTTFSATVGLTTPLASLTTNGGGTTAVNGGPISTTGAQTYNDAVTLGADTTFTSTAGGAVTFGGTVQSPGTPRALTVSAGGGAAFAGALGGGGAPLASFTTGGATTATINGGSVTTVGPQFLNGPVNVGAATTFSSTGGGAIEFASTLNGAFDVNVNTTGGTMFAGAVGGTTNLASLTTDGGGTTLIAGGAVTTTGAQSYNDAVTLFSNTVLNAGAGNLTFGSTLNGGVTLDANSTGTTTFAGAVGGTAPLTSLTTNAGGTTSITGGSIRTTGAQTYNDAVNAAAVALTTTGAGAGITATNAANDFTGVTSFNTAGAGNVSVTDANAITFGSTSVPGGTLAVIAPGGIAQTAPITANTLTIQTTNANATLNGATNSIATLGASDLGTGTLNLLNGGALNVAGVVTAGGATLNTTGALTDSAGARIVTAGSNGAIALTGSTIGTAAAPFSVNAGTGAVNATSTVGGAFLEQSSGDLLTSRYTVNVPTGQNIGLAANAGGITVDASVNAPNRNLALTTFTAGNTIGIGNGVTVDAAGLTIDTTAASATLSIANSDVTLNSLVTTGANVATTISGTSVVTANGATTFGGPLSWSGTGTLAGTGGVTAGTVNMVGGSPHLGTTLTTTTYNQGPGGLTIDTNGVLNLTNAGSATINGTQLVNSGRVNVGGAGSVLLRNNGFLINANLLDVQGDVSFDSDTPASPGVLINTAGSTLQKSAGAGTSAIGATGALTFTNGGVLSAQTGTIEYRQNSNTFNTGTQFTGAGTHLITGNSNFNGTATNAGTLTVNGGTQTIAGSLVNSAGATLNLGAGGGNIAGTGTLSNAGSLTSASAGTHTIASGSFANTGSVTVNSGALVVSSNDVDGTRASGDTGSYVVTGGANLAFSDSTRDFLAGSSIGGAGNVTFASTASSTFNVRGPYSPGGTFIRGATTTVNFFGPTTMAALDMNAGAMGIGAGGVLTLNGAGTTSITGGTLTNFGEIDVTGGTAALNGAFPTNNGIVRIGGGATLATTANLTNASTGFIGGTGTLNVGAGNTFINNGTFSPGASPGTFTITGNYTQGPGGTMAIELGGTNPGVTYDLVNVSGVATLGGTLNVALVNGFTPAGSDRFDFMTFASRVGDFSTFAFPAGSGLISQPGATTYALVGTLLPFDISGELRRLYDDMQRLAAEDSVQEVKIVKGGRLICE
ncbi:MAG TPA: filamentous hemagglutinin N-terminal domain-containing protein [Burkholderiales bacterium]|nr:filamentous hemagglutinin N-terminal domain-containing protein [Burkholderiales bacterium]